MAMKLLTKALSLAVFVVAVAQCSAQAEEMATMTELGGETLEYRDFSLRRGGAQGQRRLFYFGNLLYKLHICQDSSGWCPEPHCHGPLAPPSCHSRSGSSSGGSSSSSGGSSGTSTSASSSSTSDVTYADAQDAVDYDNNGEAIYADYQEDSGNFATVVDGTQGQRNGGDSQVHHNQLYAFLAAATVAGVVGAILMKKNKSKSEDDLDHQLSQSVSRRLENLLAGKHVHPVHDGAAVGPAFVKSASDGPLVPPSLPSDQNMYDEPDQEAIEIKLNNSESDYVKMGA